MQLYEYYATTKDNIGDNNIFLLVTKHVRFLTQNSTTLEYKKVGTEAE